MGMQGQHANEMLSSFMRAFDCITHNKSQAEHLRNRMLRAYRTSQRDLLANNARMTDKLYSTADATFTSQFFRVRKMKYSFFFSD